MADYITAAALKDTLTLTGTTFADADITRAITSASRAIDEMADRKFSLGSNGEIRYFTPTRPRVLEIDDAVTITTVKSDDDGDGVFERTWTINTDFVSEPLNAAGDGRPWEQLRVRHAGRYWWPVGIERGVEITGRFGWTVPPDMIVQATIILATRLLTRAREAPFGVVGLSIDGAAAIRLGRNDPDVVGLVEPFSRRPLVA